MPRGLRKVLYQNNSDGDPLVGTRDLSLSSGVEQNRTQHSPIIGWSYDGLPIYGPYGYEKSTGGSVVQLNSGYSVDLKTNRPPTTGPTVCPKPTLVLIIPSDLPLSLSGNKLLTIAPPTA